MKQLFAVKNQSIPEDLTLLLIRVVVGIAFILHGWGKIQSPFSWMHESSIPGILQALGAIAEFGGGIALILGVVSNLAAFGIFCTMIVAAIYHGVVRGDPFMGKGGPSYELAVAYLMISLLLMVMGPGRFSLDRKIFGVKSA